jgi:hypothetical protein
MVINSNHSQLCVDAWASWSNLLSTGPTELHPRGLSECWISGPFLFQFGKGCIRRAKSCRVPYKCLDRYVKPGIIIPTISSLTTEFQLRVLCQLRNAPTRSQQRLKRFRFTCKYIGRYLSTILKPPESFSTLTLSTQESELVHTLGQLLLSPTRHISLRQEVSSQ